MSGRNIQKERLRKNQSKGLDACFELTFSLVLGMMDKKKEENMEAKKFKDLSKETKSPFAGSPVDSVVTRS